MSRVVEESPGHIPPGRGAPQLSTIDYCRAPWANPFECAQGRLRPPPHDLLLQPESFPHQALQTGFIENIESEFLVGKHSKRGLLGSGGEF